MRDALRALVEQWKARGWDGEPEDEISAAWRRGFDTAARLCEADLEDVIAEYESRSPDGDGPACGVLGGSESAKATGRDTTGTEADSFFSATAGSEPADSLTNGADSMVSAEYPNKAGRLTVGLRLRASIESASLPFVNDARTPEWKETAGNLSIGRSDAVKELAQNFSNPDPVKAVENESLNARLLQASCLLDGIVNDIADDETHRVAQFDAGVLAGARCIVEQCIDLDYEPWVAENTARPERRLLRAFTERTEPEPADSLLVAQGFSPALRLVDRWREEARINREGVIGAPKSLRWCWQRTAEIYEECANELEWAVLTKRTEAPPSEAAVDPQDGITPA